MKHFCILAGLIGLAACSTSSSGGSGGTGGSGGSSFTPAAFSSAGYATPSSDVFEPGTTFTVPALVAKGTIDDDGFDVDSVERGSITLTRASSGDGWIVTPDGGSPTTLYAQNALEAYNDGNSSDQNATGLVLGRQEIRYLTGFRIEEDQYISTSGGTQMFVLYDGSDQSGSSLRLTGQLATGILGYNTDPSQLSNSGSATYNGNAFIGGMTDQVYDNYYSTDNYLFTAYGPATLNMDFDAQSLSGNIDLTNFDSSEDDYLLSNNVTLTNGVISGNRFTADLSFDDLGALNLTDATADLQGDFYEDGGKVVGGTILGTATVDRIDVYGSPDLRDTPATLIGGFLAEK